MKYPYHGKDFGDLSRFEQGTHQRLFRAMLRMRLIEEAIEADYKNDLMKSPIHLVIGQEASSVGFCEAMRKEDLVYCGHRTHGVYLGKGGDLDAMLAELHCRTTGCAASRGGSMHLLDKAVGMAGSSAICGGAPPIATGHAHAVKMLNQGVTVSVFLGDGAAEEGAVWESLNWAALKKLPILYVCENNYFSVFTPLNKRQPEHVELYKKAEAFGLKSVKVDGTNILDCYEAGLKALEHIRETSEPVFIEAHMYRWRGHGGAGDDNHKGYRDPAELADWQRHCPVESYYAALLEAGLISASDRTQMVEQIEEEIQKSFEFARNSPEPGVQELATHVYQ